MRYQAGFLAGTASAFGVFGAADVAGKPDLHYCQRTTASWDWSLRPAGCDLETDRKRDKWLNGKALIRKATEAEHIHYCQLGKLAVVCGQSKRFSSTEGTN
jgi:hypothetical protein